MFCRQQPVQSCCHTDILQELDSDQKSEPKPMAHSAKGVWKHTLFPLPSFQQQCWSEGTSS